MTDTLLPVFLIGMAAGLGAITTAWSGIFSPWRRWIGPILRKQGKIGPLLEVFIRCPYCQGFHYVEFFLIFSGVHLNVVGPTWLDWILTWWVASAISLLFVGFYGLAMGQVDYWGSAVGKEMKYDGYGFGMVLKDTEDESAGETIEGLKKQLLEQQKEIEHLSTLAHCELEFEPEEGEDGYVDRVSDQVDRMMDAAKTGDIY